MDIRYVGESLLPGQLGHALIVLAFTTALVALVAFSFATNKAELAEAKSWRRLGKIAWFTHLAAVLGTIAVLYWIIFNHHFEYDYVRRTSAESTPLKYLISSMWSQQQGSFLLWIFWHAVIGTFLVLAVKPKWSNPAMAVFAFVQLVVCSMILGVMVDRWIALAILLVAFQIPLWLWLQQRGVAGWKALVPVLNVITAVKANARTAKQHLTGTAEDESPVRPRTPIWLLIILAVPINYFLFVWLPINYSGATEFLAETIAIGTSPFELARDRFASNSIFLFPDYLNVISGKGLNPLLENYWMVIHPPTLFLGFASTLVPFSLAIAGLWTRDFTGWWKPALPFTVFATMILGTGIMMGGVWAYEALSFGGFWAWDPVENASLIPWLTLLAGLHTMIIFKSTGRALRITFILLISTTFLILYSTFLTRSGILGDTSVHAFTDLGMEAQLLLLICAITLPAVIWLIISWKSIPTRTDEESVWSREFWMFIGAYVLVISALHITFSTSLPVVNKIFGTDLASPEDAEGYYNSVQVWIGIIIAVLSASALFFKFKKTPVKGLMQLLIHAGVALALTILVSLSLDVSQAPYYILLFSGLFAVSASLHYFIRIIRKKFKLSGASLAHLGFGLIMIGLVVALANSRVISENVSGFSYNPDAPDEFNYFNVRLNKGESVPMSNYQITYLGREQDSINFYYRVLYEKFDSESGEVSESFELRPHLMDHPDMGLVANPSTKHYLGKDIFTHVSSIPGGSEHRSLDQPQVTTHNIAPGDSFWTSKGLVVFENFTPLAEGNDVAVIANLKVKTLEEDYLVKPVFSITDNTPSYSEARVEALDLTLALTEISPQQQTFTFRAFEKVDWIIMKAIVFPFINLLWLGIVLTIVGFLITLRKRILEFKRVSSRP